MMLAVVVQTSEKGLQTVGPGGHNTFNKDGEASGLRESGVKMALNRCPSCEPLHLPISPSRKSRGMVRSITLC